MGNRRTDSEILDYLSSVLEKEGRDLSQRDFGSREYVDGTRIHFKVYYKRFGSWDKAKRKALGIGTKDDSKTKIEKDYKGTSVIITTRSLDIKTLEDALKASEVDLEQWEVERYVINSWEVTIGGEGTFTNYQVKVWLKQKVKSVVELGIEELIKEIPKFKPPKVKRKIPQTPYAMEVCPFDAHFGKLAWGKETMQGDYDLNVATKWFLKSIEENLNLSANFNISKIIYILGQDLMHVENYQGETPIGGNSLDVDSRLPKIYQKTKAATIQGLYMCREVAPVEVLWIPGNHDMHSSFYLSDVIKEHFLNDSFVEVDNTPPWRKARLWGNLLVGYTHDTSIRTVNVVNMLPQFWPKLWGESKFREWHTGHKHKKQEQKFMPTMTVGGVIIRQIPTLSTIDAWHYQYGFVDAVPASESFIWSKENGIIAHFTAFVNKEE